VASLSASLRDTANLSLLFKQGHPFGPMFKAGLTVGCGIRINPATGTMFVFFTNNGALISGEGGAYMECEHQNWYPAVGIDSYDAVHVNFGQEPFVYSEITGTATEVCISARRCLHGFLPTAWCCLVQTSCSKSAVEWQTPSRSSCNGTRFATRTERARQRTKEI